MTNTRSPTRGAKPGRGNERPLPGTLSEGEGEAAADNEAQGEAQAIAARLTRLGARLNITEPASVDDAWERVVINHDRATRATVYMGFDLVWIKDKVPHGEFGQRLEALHIHPRRAQKAIQIARWLGKCDSESHLKKLLDLGPEKLRLLSRVAPEIIETQGVQAEIDLDDVACMSVADLRKNLRKTRQKYNDSERQKEHWRHQAHQFQHAAGVATAGSEYPASVTRARSEGAALGDQALAVIGALERQARDLLSAPDLGATRPTRVANLEAAARALYLQSAAVSHAAARSLAATRELLADWLPAADDWSIDDQPAPLHPNQVESLAQWRQVHHRQMADEAAARESARVLRGEIKRLPGRPRKAGGDAPKRRPGRPSKRR